MSIRTVSRKLLLLGGVLSLLLSACSSTSQETSPTPPSTPVLASVSTAPFATPSLQAPSAWTADQVRKQLRADWTQKQVIAAFGEPTEEEDVFFYRDPVHLSAKKWTYAQGQTSLALIWSPDEATGQRLWDAVLYDQDAAGKRRSFIPQMGALKAASSSDENEAARQAGITIGQQVKVHVRTAGYDLLAGAKPTYNYSALPNRDLRVLALTSDFAKVDDQGFQFWVPIWYFTPEADQAKEIDLAVMKVRAADTAALWYPDGHERALELTQGERVYAVSAFGDWYGVAVPDQQGRIDGYGLLWVRASELKSEEGVGFSPFGTESTISSEATAAIVRSALGIEVTQSRVLRLFGKPHSIERSRNIAEPPGLKTLEVWRYENDHAQLELTWSDAGRLWNENYRNATSPAASFGNEDWVNNESQIPLIKQVTTATAEGEQPFAATQALTIDWRTNLGLPFTYLIGKANDTLLVEGEDGGFSGMHDQSILYGLDQRTGRKRWQYSYGYAYHAYALSGDGKTVVFANNTSDAESKRSIIALDTATGKKLWSQLLQVKGNIGQVQLAASGGKVGISYTSWTTGEQSEATTLMEARDLRSGKRIWQRSWAGESRVIEQDGRLPVLLVQTSEEREGTLAAYDPATGHVRWKLANRMAESLVYSSRIQADTRIMGVQQGGYWTTSLSTNEIIYTNASNGQDIIKLPLPAQGRYILLNEQYAIRLTSKDGLEEYQSKQMESELIDLHTGKVQWAVAGKVTDGMIEKDVIYMRLDGKLRKAKLSTGEIIWSADALISGKMVMYQQVLLVESEPDVYAINSQTGKPLYRVQGMRIGRYDFTPQQYSYGLLTVLDNKLYTGSANGVFSRLK